MSTPEGVQALAPVGARWECRRSWGTRVYRLWGLKLSLAEAVADRQAWGAGGGAPRVPWAPTLAPQSTQ